MKHIPREVRHTNVGIQLTLSTALEKEVRNLEAILLCMKEYDMQRYV